MAKISWSQRWQIFKSVIRIMLEGKELLWHVGIATGVLPKPSGEPMSAFSVVSGIVKTIIADKTWAQVEHMAKTADKAMQSGDLLLKVIKDHGKVSQDDVKLGLEIATLVAPRIAEELVRFLAGPAGGPALALFQFWLTGLLTGSPIQPKDPAYNAPAGQNHDTSKTVGPTSLGGIGTGA